MSCKLKIREIAIKMITWLKEHGRGDQASRVLNVPADGAWMPFTGEWQDWSFADPEKNAQRLFVGYWFEQNGDTVYDPLIIVDLTTDSTSIMFQPSFGNPMDGDDPYTVQFLELVWDRHFPAAVEGDRETSFGNP